MANKKSYLEIYNGRKGEPNEYFELRMVDHGINLVAQKSQPARSNPLWFTYIVKRDNQGMGGIRPVEVYKEGEEANKALETMYHTIIQYLSIL